MVCLACRRPNRLLVCRGCATGLRRGRPRTVGGLPVLPAFRHDGLARTLIHDLKYRGLRPVAHLMASEMAGDIPAAASTLVPIPRVTLRRLSLGVDPALELAYALSRLTGLPTVPSLRAPAWGRRHAGRSQTDRHPVGFALRGAVPAGSVLIDDVVTTGATLLSAAAAAGPSVIGAVTATGASV